LVTVNASNNAVGNVKFLEELQGSDRLQFLQKLNLSNNRIRELNPIPQPRLSWLDLSKNKIETCVEFTGHDNLITLLMANNRLETAAGLA